jgi:hypothetical protein
MSPSVLLLMHTPVSYQCQYEFVQHVTFFMTSHCLNSYIKKSGVDTCVTEVRGLQTECLLTATPQYCKTYCQYSRNCLGHQRLPRLAEFGFRTVNNNLTTHFTMLVTWKQSDCDFPRLLLDTGPKSRRPCFSCAKRSCRRRCRGCTSGGANCPCRCKPLSRTWIYKMSYEEKYQKYEHSNMKTVLNKTY